MKLGSTNLPFLTFTKQDPNKNNPGRLLIEGGLVSCQGEWIMCYSTGYGEDFRFLIRTRRHRCTNMRIPYVRIAVYRCASVFVRMYHIPFTEPANHVAFSGVT